MTASVLGSSSRDLERNRILNLENMKIEGGTLHMYLKEWNIEYET